MLRANRVLSDYPESVTSLKTVTLALWVAEDLGLPVFPCGLNKQPAIPGDAGGHGYLDASTDPTTVRALFSHHAARLIGLPTGTPSGLAVVDIDLPRHDEAQAWWHEHRQELRHTSAWRTRSGGLHLYFRHPPGLRCSQGKLAPGVDVRAAGGYVIAWWAHGLKRLCDAEPAPFPDWLFEQLVRRPSRPDPAPAIDRSVSSVADGLTQKRINGLFARLLGNLRSAPDGTKHATLLRVARTIGGLQHALPYSEDQIVCAILGALPDTVRDWNLARRTALDGLHRGAESPIQLAERPYGARP
jgi:Bifunctional DNA primase/polymerase, N-terminal